MYKVRSEFLNYTIERGLLNQCTDLEKLDDILLHNKIVGYLGIDPTADSLHVGNLVTLTLLKLFQKFGNKPIILFGGATGLIGDPSGRSSERPIVTTSEIQKNLQGITRSVKKFFNVGSNFSDAIIINNYDWFKDLGYINFLSNYGRYFSVNEMLKKESVKIRLDREQSLSFLEFNYSLFQAYDFLEIYKRYGSILQIGGADQWGNIISGIDLGRKLGFNLFGITVPLLVDANGVKFGKSMGNAIWLNEDKVTSYDYYQFWRNVDDRDVSKFLKIFTDLPITEINKLSVLQGSELNEAKKILAFEATKICRGEEDALLAQKTAIEIFEKNLISDNLATINIEQNINIIDLLLLSGFVKSKSEARRLIQSNAITINNNKIIDIRLVINKDTVKDEKFILSFGKKNKILVKFK